MPPLVTLEQLKSYIGEDSLLLDSELTTLLTAASLVIRRHIDPIENVTYTGETYNGTGQSWIALEHWPFVAVDEDEELEVLINDVDVTALCKFEARSGRLYYAPGFPVGVQNISVTYAAGYGATVPEDLQAACLMLAKFYAKSDLMARSVFFEGGGGMGAERAMPTQVRAILESYPSYEG